MESTLLKEFNQYFEKNILLKEDKLDSTLKNNKPSIRNYLDDVVKEKTLQVAMDSEPVQCIWKALKSSLFQEEISSQKMNYNKYFESFDNKDSEFLKSIFKIEELTYLITGKVVNEYNGTWREILSEHIKKDKTRVNIPFAPIVFKTCPSINLKSFIIENMTFEVPESMTISTYFNRTFGLINSMPDRDIERALFDYLNNAKNPIRELYELFESYACEPVSNSHNQRSIELNEVSADNILKIFNNILPKEGLDFFLNLNSDEDELIVFRLISHMINLDLIKVKNGKNYKAFLYELNLKEYELEKNFQEHLNDESIAVLVNEFKKNTIDTIYLNTSHFALSLSNETIELIKDNKEAFTIKESVVAEWNQLLSSELEEKAAMEFKDFKLKLDKSVSYLFEIIFSEKIEMGMSNYSREDVEKNQMKIVDFYINNKSFFIEENRLHRGIETDMIIDVAQECLKSLMEIEKEM